MTRLISLVALGLALAACSTEQRYLVDPPVAEGTARLAVRTLEVRDVSLPSYAEASEILLEDESGALTQIKGALWADDPARAMTLSLADRIGLASSATVSPEPWPLEEDAQAAVTVRVSQLVARASGTVDLTGQFAISSYDRVVRERIERFTISVPLTDTSPAAIADATGRAIGELAGRITTSLRR